MKQRIVVGLSGGVDSAVTAYLLKQQGHEVVGIFMKNWEDDDDDEYCSTRQDFLDAASVADVLGIEIEHVNFAADYKDRVFAEFLTEYQAGRTPNPDVLCNAEIKFKAFLDHAMRLGAEKIATGHYARVRQNPISTLFELLKGRDPSKDQSYFLHRLNQAQLAKTLFPVGELHKTEVRRIAAEIGLPNAKNRAPSKSLRGARWASIRACRFIPWANAKGWALAGSRKKACPEAVDRTNPGLWLAKTWPPTPFGWCRATTIPGCFTKASRPTRLLGWPGMRPTQAPRFPRTRPWRPKPATAKATLRAAWWGRKRTSLNCSSTKPNGPSRPVKAPCCTRARSAWAAASLRPPGPGQGLRPLSGIRF